MCESDFSWWCWLVNPGSSPQLWWWMFIELVICTIAVSLLYTLHTYNWLRLHKGKFGHLLCLIRIYRWSSLLDCLLECWTLKIKYHYFSVSKDEFHNNDNINQSIWEGTIIGSFFTVFPIFTLSKEKEKESGWFKVTGLSIVILLCQSLEIVNVF